MLNILRGKISFLITFIRTVRGYNSAEFPYIIIDRFRFFFYYKKSNPFLIIYLIRLIIPIFRFLY